jgi:hypothetical protein
MFAKELLFYFLQHFGKFTFFAHPHFKLAKSANFLILALENRSKKVISKNPGKNVQQRKHSKFNFCL